MSHETTIARMHRRKRWVGQLLADGFGYADGLLGSVAPAWVEYDTAASVAPSASPLLTIAGAGVSTFTAAAVSRCAYRTPTIALPDNYSFAAAGARYSSTSGPNLSLATLSLETPNNNNTNKVTGIDIEVTTGGGANASLRIHNQGDATTATIITAGTFVAAHGLPISWRLRGSVVNRVVSATLTVTAWNVADTAILTETISTSRAAQAIVPTSRNVGFSLFWGTTINDRGTLQSVSAGPL